MEKFNVTIEQLKDLIELTQQSLETLDFQFIIVNNKIDFCNTDFYQTLNDEDKQRILCFMSHTSSFYVASANLIVILLDDIKGKNYREKSIYFTSTLFHEIRHVWQRENEIFNLSDALNPKDEDYSKQPHEMDAKVYQMWATNKFRKEISTIFNIDQDWTFKISL